MEQNLSFLSMDKEKSRNFQPAIAGSQTPANQFDLKVWDSVFLFEPSHRLHIAAQ